MSQDDWKLGQAVICFYIFQSRQTIKWVWNLPWEAAIVSGCLTWHSFCFRLIGSLPRFHFATSCGEQSGSFSPRGLNLQLCQEKQWVLQNSRQCAPLWSCCVFTIVLLLCCVFKRASIGADIHVYSYRLTHTIIIAKYFLGTLRNFVPFRINYSFFFLPAQKQPF